MKVIIAGSRSISYSEIVPQVCKYVDFPITEIVSGNANGIDAFGEKYAKDFGIDLTIMPANWNKYHKAAGFIRNERMAKYADALVAIWDGKSKGTQHMIKTMEKLGKPVFVYICETVN